MRNILVVYYSWGNNIKAVAEYLSQKLGADLLELKPKEAWCLRAKSRARWCGLWAEQEGIIANPVRIFLHQNDFSARRSFHLCPTAPAACMCKMWQNFVLGLRYWTDTEFSILIRYPQRKTRRKIWKITRRILTGGLEKSGSDINFLRRPTIFNKKI